MFSNWALRFGIAGAHRLLLQRLSPAVSVFAEQLGHDVSTGRSPQRRDPLGDLPPRQVRPFHVGPHRIAGGVVLKHLEEVLLEGRVDLDQPFAPTPFFRTRPVSSSSIRFQFRLPLPDGLGIAPQDAARCTRRHHAPTWSPRWRHNAVDRSLESESNSRFIIRSISGAYASMRPSLMLIQERSACYHTARRTGSYSRPVPKLTPMARRAPCPAEKTGG